MKFEVKCHTVYHYSIIMEAENQEELNKKTSDIADKPNKYLTADNIQMRCLKLDSLICIEP